MSLPGSLENISHSKTGSLLSHEITSSSPGSLTGIQIIDSILKQLECVMRGKRIDESFLLEQSVQLFDWAYGDYLKNKSSNTQHEKELQQRFIDLAVALHNKSKSVVGTSSIFSEALTNLKASAAWILSTYGHSSTKFVIMFIRLHCRVANEMISLEKLNTASLSLKKATECWEMLNSQALERILPPVDLEGLRFVVFTAFLDFSKLLRNSNGSEEDVKRCIGSALELVDYLPSVRLVFCRHALELGQELAIQKRSYPDAIHYMRIALSSILILQRSPNENEGENENLDVLLAKTYLSLAYAYQELNECEKAISCISDAETSVTKGVISTETFTFARFSVLCTANNEAEAGRMLLNLFEETTSFEMAFNSMLLFLRGNDSQSHESIRRYLDYFNILGRKFSQDPEFSILRVTHLQYSFLTVPIEDQANDSLQRAKELCHSIIRDHQQHIHQLSGDLYKKFLVLLQERVKLYRAQGWWKESIEWCNIMLSFIDTNDLGNWAVIMMWKSDASLHVVEKRDEALALAMACVKMVKSTHTILIAFHTALYTCSAEKAVDVFFTLLKESQQIQIPHEHHNIPQVDDKTLSSQDFLARLLMGCQVLKESKAENLSSPCSERHYGTSRDFILSKILSEWMRTYLDLRSIDKKPDETICPVDLSEDFVEHTPDEISFCEVLSEFISLFLRINLQKHESIEEKIDATSRHQGGESRPLKRARQDSCESLQTNRKYFTCSGNHIRDVFLRNVHILVKILEEDMEDCKYSPPVYHSVDSVLKIAEIVWNVGIILVGDIDRENTDHIELGADILEECEVLLKWISSRSPTVMINIFRFKCLLSSTSARMDLTSRDVLTANLVESSNLGQIVKNIQLLSDFVVTIPELPIQLNKIYIILSIAISCRTASPELEKLIDAHEGDLLMFSPQELEKCADIAQYERFGNLVVCRKMLQYAIQVLARERAQDYSLLGSLYRRLIFLSPTRQKALEWIEDFEQLRKSINGSDQSIFNPSDIDAICIMCYNWGVTLVELGQYDLAEKFACKSLGFSKHISGNLAKLKETIQVPGRLDYFKNYLQDAYLYILKRKNDQKGEQFSSSMTLFGIQNPPICSTSIHLPTSSLEGETGLLKIDKE